MFPLEFPKAILAKHGKRKQLVVDPFCGRGTTNFAARINQIDSLGIDSSPVAVAIAQAKSARATPDKIVSYAKDILESDRRVILPKGSFWDLAYHRDVLRQLCIFRDHLIEAKNDDTAKALRGILLGALHGPIGKTVNSYFSNQCPRTFAPKPDYSVRFWKKNRLTPPNVDLLKIIEVRALRYFSQKLPDASSKVVLADSRSIQSIENLVGRKTDWIITSPPYYEDIYTRSMASPMVFRRFSRS